MSNKTREALELALDTLDRYECVSEQTKQFTADAIADALEDLNVVDENTIDELVDKKNELVRELNDVLELLSAVRVDMLCDTDIRNAVTTHPAMELSGK